MIRGLSVALLFDRLRCREGDDVRIRLALRNRLPFAACGLQIDEGIAGHSRIHSPRARLCGIARIAGWKQTEISISFQPACRGEYPRAAPRVTSGFPFGLWTPSRGLAGDQHPCGLAQDFPGRSDA
jgi:uncharacterized protein (DUF58 family)